MAFGGHDYLLMPVGLVEAGEDFEIARYRVMQQA
jgi:hypothetical protein